MKSYIFQILLPLASNSFTWAWSPFLERHVTLYILIHCCVGGSSSLVLSTACWLQNLQSMLGATPPRAHTMAFIKKNQVVYINCTCFSSLSFVELCLYICHIYWTFQNLKQNFEPTWPASVHHSDFRFLILSQETVSLFP